MVSGARILLLAALVVVLLPSPPVWGGAEIRIDDKAKIDLGFRLQALYLRTERDVDGESSDFEDFDDFRVRRARVRLGADITPWVHAFLQTEFAEDESGSGGDMRIIDAFVQLKPHPLANLLVGENMAPVTRQNLTGSGALMAIDRPAITYKNLTWGTRALAAFATSTVADTDAGLRGDVDVRDTGATLFGVHSFTERLHLKYFLGAYDGIQEADEDSERYAGRIQVNLFDAEPGYYNSSTYLGKKKTIAVGAAYDTQSDVARDLTTGDTADYDMFTVDLFSEWPLGPGSLTAEAAYLDMDLDGAEQLDVRGNGTRLTDARQAQGDGFYLQVGYFWKNWQPWAEYEQWDSDGADGRGSFDSMRLGLSYFILGHNANIKAGYEIFKADEDFSDTREDAIHTFATGLYVTY